MMPARLNENDSASGLQAGEGSARVPVFKRASDVSLRASSMSLIGSSISRRSAPRPVIAAPRPTA